jgi:hypothetical protein
MFVKMVLSTTLYRLVLKYVAFLMLASISCLDFQFESEYEDVNGIYLEHVRSYEYVGTKILLDGSTGYVASAESLLIFDFTEIDSAVYLGYYNADNNINDFQIYEECAVLVTDRGMEIVDITDSLPSLLSAVSFFSLGSDIEISNDHAFVVSQTWLYVVNISDRQNPILTNSFQFDDYIRQVEVDANFAYVLSGTDFSILDIQNPCAPVLACSTSLVPSGILNPLAFAKKDDFFYFSGYSPFSAKLFACELTASNDMKLLNYIACPGFIRQFCMSNGYTLAVSLYEAYLINLQYPSSPCISEVVDAGGRYGIIQGNLIYILTPYLVIFEIKQVD